MTSATKTTPPMTAPAMAPELALELDFVLVVVVDETAVQ